MGIERAGSRIGRLALFAFLMTLGLVACFSPDDPTWERVQETRVLRVGMDASFPPFEAIAADGSLVGFDVDLAREVGQRLGVEAHFVANLPYDGLYDALTVGRVDVVISALVVNPARMADFAYSNPYFDAGHVLVVRRGEHTIRSMGDLGNRSLAVALGTPGDREARERARRSSDLFVVQYPTSAHALEAVRTGETDAALVDHVSALQAIGAESPLTIVGEPVVEVPYAVAMRDDSQRLLRAVNSALTAMEDDGTLDRLVNEWLKDQG
jgi:polar amino acid transport system substrate-binding protein